MSETCPVCGWLGRFLYQARNPDSFFEQWWKCENPDESDCYVKHFILIYLRNRKKKEVRVVYFDRFRAIKEKHFRLVK